MTGRHDIYDVSAWANRTDRCQYGVVGVDWASNAGFGRWEMAFDSSGIPHIYTEHMDNAMDKSFSEAILKALLDVAVIEE